MVKKPATNRVVGCEYCKYRDGGFFNDIEAPEIIRCYCKVRHTHVNAELMSKFCDFFEIDPEKTKSEDQQQTKGI